MRKVILTMNENQKYETIKKLVDAGGNKRTAALKIGYSDRHINRLMDGYKKQGKSFFVHGNRGRKPAITIPSDTKQLILDLYRSKYYDCNLTHFQNFYRIERILRYQFLTDNRTVFEYKRKNKSAVEKDTSTQFGYACKQLGVDIRTSSVLQAKGRVERMFNTLQSRLPAVLRLDGVSSIEEANESLYSYIKKFNKQFALHYDNIKLVFEMQPNFDKIN